MNPIIDHKRLESLIPDFVPQKARELPSELLLFQDDKIECWFAPLGGINKNAKIALYGITPGWTQMKISYQIAVKRKSEKRTIASMSRIAFAGSMRTNLINMLDELCIQKYLHVPSVSELFGTDALAYSSVLKYPVFVRGKNYNGHNPPLLRHPFLVNILESVLAPELLKLKDCLIVPLGKSANEGILYVQNKAALLENQVLSGFPHPSGANAHRTQQFAHKKNELTAKVNEWFMSRPIVLDKI